MSEGRRLMTASVVLSPVAAAAVVNGLCNLIPIPVAAALTADDWFTSSRGSEATFLRQSGVPVPDLNGKFVVIDGDVYFVLGTEVHPTATPSGPFGLLVEPLAVGDRLDIIANDDPVRFGPIGDTGLYVDMYYPPDDDGVFYIARDDVALSIVGEVVVGGPAGSVVVKGCLPIRETLSEDRLQFLRVEDGLLWMHTPDPADTTLWRCDNVSDALVWYPDEPCPNCGGEGATWGPAEHWRGKRPPTANVRTGECSTCNGSGKLSAFAPGGFCLIVEATP